MSRINDAGTPDRFNLLIELNSTAIFELDTFVVPEPEELYAIFEEEAMGPAFIVNIMWQAPNTIWIGAYEAFLDPLEVLDNIHTIPADGKNTKLIIMATIYRSVLAMQTYDGMR